MVQAGVVLVGGLHVERDHGDQEVGGVQRSADRQHDQGDERVGAVHAHARVGQIQLRCEAAQNGNAHDGACGDGEHRAGEGRAIARAAQLMEGCVAVGRTDQPVAGEEEHRLGQGMGDDVEHRRGEPRAGAQRDAQVDVADLCHRREGDHAPELLLQNRVDGAQDDAHHGEHQQHGLDVGGAEHRRAEHAHHELDVEEDVGLGHEACQHGAGGRRGGGVGVRQPGVEGVQRALDRQADGDQRHRERQRPRVRAGGVQRQHLIVDVLHQQMPRQAVENRDAQQEQAAAQQVHDHVAGGGEQRPATGAGHHQRTRRDGHDLDEHVGGEHVVGEQLRHHARLKQQHHHGVQALPPGLDVGADALVAAQHAEEEDQTEGHGQRGLQRPRPQLVSEGRAERAQGVAEGLAAAFQQADQQRGGRKRSRGGHDQHHGPGLLRLQHGGDGGQQQRPPHQKEGYVLPPAQCAFASLARSAMRSMSSVW